MQKEGRHMKVTSDHDVSAQRVRRCGRTPLQTEQTAAKENHFDRFTPKAAPGAAGKEPAQTAQQIADALRSQYPWVKFTFRPLGDRPEDLAQFAVSAGSGAHLVIDPDVLEWMAQGSEAWAQGMEMIGKTLHDLMQQPGGENGCKGAVIADAGEITTWTAEWEKPKTELEKGFEYMTDTLDRMEEARKQQEKKREKMKLEQKKKLNYQMGRDMTRLAKGTTDRDVRSLISSLYASRQRIAASSGYNKQEVQMALAQMDYVIGRARAKIRHLKEEGELHQRVKKAEKLQEEKRRLQLEQELKSRRRARMAKERAAIHKKMPDLPGLRGEEERRQARDEAVLSAAAQNLSAASGAALPAAPNASAGSTVVVSAPSGASVEVTITPMA